MGALPKIRISKGRKKRRRTHHSLDEPAMSSCPKCGKMRRPHFICEYCNHYGEKPKATKKKPEKEQVKVNQKTEKPKQDPKKEE